MNMRAEVGSLPGIPQWLRPWAPIALVATCVALVVMAVTTLLPIQDWVLGVHLDPAIPHSNSLAVEFESAAAQFEQADPVADAMKAMDAGDTRLWAATGNGWAVPGADGGRHNYYRRNYGLRYYQTSCVIEGEEHARLLTAIETYAEQYNSTILGSIHR